MGITIDNSIQGLIDLLSKLPKNAALNFERKYLRTALTPYRNDFVNYLKANYPKSGVRSYSRGKVVETTGRMARSVTNPKTKKVSDMGQSKDQLRILGYFYAKKQEDLPKSKRNPAKRPNVGTVMGWLNFGTLTHATGKGDITSKNVISRINYFEKRRTELLAKRTLLMEKLTKSNASKLQKIQDQLNHVNDRYTSLINRKGGRMPGQGHDTGKLVKGVTARNFVTEHRRKMYNNLNQSMIEFIENDVNDYIAGINKGNYISGLAKRY